MSLARPFLLVHTKDQWSRATHTDTRLQPLGPQTCAVQLASVTEPSAEESTEDGVSDDAPIQALPVAGGLAFDPWCRLFRTVPDHGRVERLLWAGMDPTDPVPRRPAPVDLFASEEERDHGDFAAVEPHHAPLQQPRGLAIDDQGRLYVAETGAARVLVYDLLEQRLLGRVRIGPGWRRPLDLATDGRHVYVVLDGPPAVAVFEGLSTPRLLSLPDLSGSPSRIAICPRGQLYLLVNAGERSARVVPVAKRGEGIEVPRATDLEFVRQPDHNLVVLVVSRLPDSDFRRYVIDTEPWDDIAPLSARGYDGLGIVRTPDDRVGYWTSRGFRHAMPAKVRYAGKGRVATYRLDSGRFKSVWGRIFLDACIPPGTGIKAHCVAVDELPKGATVVHDPPQNTESGDPDRQDLTPPMLPALLEPKEGAAWQSLHLRETGRELPFARQAPGDPFQTYEAPVIADPGRYLWVTLELTGNARTTPRCKSLRIECASHDLLRRLPRIYAKDAERGDFLRRYLAMFDGFLADPDTRAFARRALFDPRSAPREMLPWLAGFVGLTLDERWPLSCKRELIEQAVYLFRIRGTIAGLTRFLEIYLDKPVTIIEHYRLRGMGGAIVGAEGELESSSVVGAGFRVGGAISTEPEARAREAAVPEDAFSAHAHRFSVVIPASLTREQEEVVRHILEVHRPAHTLYDLCTVDAGMRVGIGLYVELNSIVGHSGGFGPLVAEGSRLGRGAVLGCPRAGTRVGGSRVGRDSRIG